MTRTVYTVDLSPRENCHRESIGLDVWDVVGMALLGFLLLIVAIVLMA